MSDNYYIVLGLGPSVDDWSVVDAAIQEHRRSWSLQKNQGAPAARRKAERYLKLIPDMDTKLRDPKQRRTIAGEAQKEMKDQKAQQLSSLDGLINMIRSPSLTPDDVKLLVLQCGGGITESDVIARLKACGKTLASGGSAKSAPMGRPRLDAAIARPIQDNLRHIKKKSLYDFLGIGPRSSPKSLHDAADEIYKNLQGKGLTDPDSTARKELAGYCKAVFKDSPNKDLYDNSYSAEAMDELKKHLEIVGRNHFLDQAGIDTLVGEARRRGIGQTIALEYIKEYAKSRKWGIPGDADLRSADLKLCGFCDALAPQATDLRCRDCGQELVQPCPRCSQPTPTQDECCGKCGCSTGDAPVVQGLLREGNEHLAKHDLSAAVACFDRALSYWENWQPAIEAKQRTVAMRDQRDSALQTVEGVVRARKLEEAQGALNHVRRTFGARGTEDLGRQIEAGISHARAAFGTAEVLRRADKGEDAVEKYSEALGHCADFQPALQALAQCPPPSPSGLQVSLAGTTAQLRWDTVATRGILTFRVQRKASGAPTGPKDGTMVCEVGVSRCHDTELPPGTAWHYSVFAVRGGVASAGAATSGPHLRLADPSDLVVEAGDGQVSLRWTRPPGCTTVEVWRENGSPPTGVGRGTRVVGAKDSVVDQGLCNDSSYGYLIVACFTDPTDGRGVLRAPGIAVSATPVALPPRVDDLRARREDRVAVLTWTPPARGHVQIRQTRQLPDFSPGRIIPLSSADLFGVPVSATGPDSAQAALDGQGQVFFVPLSVIAETAVVGPAVAVTDLDDVMDLEPHRQGDAIHLTWTWPTGAAEVLVTWRHDLFPTKPDDMAGGCRVVTRAEYDQRSWWELRNAQLTRHYFTVFVRDPGTDIYSRGTQAVEASGLEAQVTYRVVVRQNPLHRTLQEAWVDFRKEDIKTFSGLQAAVEQLVRKRGPLRRTLQEAWIDLRTKDVKTIPGLYAVLRKGFPPIHAADGHVVANLERLDFLDGTARIDLPMDGSTGFVKLFFKDEHHAREIRLLPAAQERLRLG